MSIYYELQYNIRPLIAFRIFMYGFKDMMPRGVVIVLKAKKGVVFTPWSVLK